MGNGELSQTLLSGKFDRQTEHHHDQLRIRLTVKAYARHIRDALLDIAADHDAEVRGRGMIQGIEFVDHSIASRISREAFCRGLIIETAGPNDEVIKTLPPLTISNDVLSRGLKILQESAAAATSQEPALAN